jgi:hypothetical protein
MRRDLPALALVAAVAAGCGTASPDLFAVSRTGKDPNANVRMVVSDGGTVTCNGGKAKALPGDMLLQARELSRKLDAQAALSIDLPAEKNSTLRYVVHTEAGKVAFSDTSRGRTKTIDQLVAFTKDVVEDVCGIQR